MSDNEICSFAFIRSHLLSISLHLGSIKPAVEDVSEDGKIEQLHNAMVESVYAFAREMQSLEMKFVNASAH